MDPAALKAFPKGEIMRLTKSLLFAGLFALSTGAAFAGEDSTHRWHGTGPEFQETPGGLYVFSDADSVPSNLADEPTLLSLEDMDELYIVTVEPVVIAPSEAMNDYEVPG
jgi:hypothetical protein